MKTSKEMFEKLRAIFDEARTVPDISEQQIGSNFISSCVVTCVILGVSKEIIHEMIDELYPIVEIGFKSGVGPSDPGELN